MRAKRTFLIIIIICLWTIVSYYFIMKQTFSLENNSSSNYLNLNMKNNKNTLVNKLSYLEEGIRLEKESNDLLIKKLLALIKIREKQENIHNQKIEDEKNKILYEQKELKKKESLISENNNNFNKINNDNISSSNSLVDMHNQNHTMNKKYLNEFNGPIIPVIVFACNRESVSKCLDNLIEYRPNVFQFPIIVSQDCDHEPTRNVILSYKDEVSLIIQPDQSEIYVPLKDKKFKGYYKIARHYGWAINNTFSKGYDYVIIVEDDLNVAPDFFDYFLGTYKLLNLDSDLWCVSAWNDNGKEKLIDLSRSDLLYRTDFFPGLGWMMTRELWLNELSPKWPKAFWDDWIRQPQQRKDRACIRPEISRTRTFGKIGVSNGLFFEKHLKYIKLSESSYVFSKANLSYLLKENYDKEFLTYVYKCPVVSVEDVRRNQVKYDGPIRIQYNTKDQFKKSAKLLGLMDDFKSGVPRTGYHGIVSFMYNNQRVYLAPNSNWNGYDLSWS